MKLLVKTTLLFVCAAVSSMAYGFDFDQLLKELGGSKFTRETGVPLMH